MLYFSAVLFGILEGITEFLPVSSTGHLLIASYITNITFSDNNVFEVAIQSGAILATLTLYRERIREALHFRSDYVTRNRWGFLVFIAFLPAAFVGFFAHDIIKSILFSPFVIALALIIGGICMIIVEHVLRRRTPSSLIEIPDALTFKQAFFIGCFQTIAMIPGSSRSACTIIGGMIIGLKRTAAAEFSFLLALPTMIAATVFDLFKNYESLNTDTILLIGIGFIAAYITAFFTMKVLLSYVKKYDFLPFAYYRIIIGCLLLWII